MEQAKPQQNTNETIGSPVFIDLTEDECVTHEDEPAQKALFKGVDVSNSPEADEGLAYVSKAVWLLGVKQNEEHKKLFQNMKRGDAVPPEHVVFPTQEDAVETKQKLEDSAMGPYVVTLGWQTEIVDGVTGSPAGWILEKEDKIV